MQYQFGELPRQLVANALSLQNLNVFAQVVYQSLGQQARRCTKHNAQGEKLGPVAKSVHRPNGRV
jgi:hypothetical protein